VSPERVRVGREGPVAIIEIVGSTRRNALTPELADQLRSALEDVQETDDVGAIVVATEGPSFCSGADRSFLSRVGKDPTSIDSYAELRRIYAMFAAYREARVPTVAAVQGAAVGAGVNLALMCDLRIVADDVNIRGFAAAGIHPGGGHINMVRALMGAQAGAAFALFGQPLDAADAVAAGFAWKRVAREQLRPAAIAIAHAAGEDPPLARSVVSTWRALSVGLPATAATLLEQGPQAWSLQRAFAKQGKST
jgi:enoyl-CoA hydratase